MFNLRLCLFLCVNLFLLVYCSFPVEILCANSTCEEPISKAVGSVTYASSSRNVLNFKPGQEITIIGKSKHKEEYWRAIINGRKGFVPSNLIKEVRIFHKFEDLIPVSIEALTQNVSAEPKKTETDLPQNAKSLNQVQDEKITPPPPAAPTVPTDSGSPTPQDKDTSSSETFKVVEGTTVFVGSPDQITPSTTLDATPQTVISNAGGEPHKQGVLEDRATIPPEVLNLNDNYQGQMLLKKNNLTIENEDEEDESEDDEGFDEEDEEEDDEVEEEENIINTAEEEEIKKETKETVQENLEPKGENLVPTPQPYSATLKESENNVERKVETVTVVESSVSSQVSTKVGDENEKKAEIPTSLPVDSEAKVEAVTKSDEILTTAGSNPVENLKLNEVYPGINIPSQNEAQVNKDFTTPELLTPVFSNSYTVSAESVPDNIISTSNNVLENPAPDNIPSNIQNVAAPGNTPVNAEKQDSLQDTSATFPPNIALNSNDPNIVPENMVSNNFPEQVATKPEPENLNSNSIFGSSISNSVPQSSEQNTVSENIVSSPNLDNSVSNITTSDIVIENQKPTLNEETQENLELTSSISPPVVSAFETLESVSPETVTEVNIEEKSEMGATTQVPALPDQIVEEFTEVPETQTETNFGFFEKVLGSNENEKVLPTEAVEEKVVVNEVTEPSIGSEDTCQNSDYCDGFLTEEQQQQASFLYSWFPSSFNGVPLSSNTFMYLVITAVTVLLFTLGHNFIEKMGKTGPLIAKINKLEQELLVSTKECFLLKEEMQNAKEKIVLYENSANDELVVTLQTELEESKKTRSELESQIEVLQQELDAATEAGLDLNKMLSEVLTQKGGSETLLASVENLQAQLNSQQKVIDEMTKKLGVKNEENEVLQSALDAANEKAETLEEKLNDMKQNLNIHLKEKEDLVQDLKSQINQLQTRINQINETKEKDVLKVKKNSEELEKKLAETSKALNIKEEEFKTLKDSIKQFKGKGNVNLETVFDVSRCKAELANAEKEKQLLQTQLKKEEDGKKSIEEQLKALTAEVQNLKKSQEEAEQKKDEAEKKLEVLSNYFKEKETQLQKELGLQEALWAQKKGDEKAVYNMMKSLQEEVESYKSQNETLKKEILDQERGLKNQIASLKQKAHENWVAARQAERKLEESKQETAQLRNRLTLVEKNTNNVDGKVLHRTSEELNGEPNSPVVMHDTSSPLLFPPPLGLDPSLPPGFMPPHPMFMPPPMSGFMPPPPPPFLPGDRRPPPLGRMSSPPLNNRFSPSSPADFPFERMSSPPLSPPARNYRSPNEADRDSYRHRSPPYPPLHPRNWDDGNEIPGFIPISSQRESIREHKGSNVSSGHSSSDSLDKSSRHSGRV